MTTGCITERGESYSGTANITVSGSTCLHWNTIGGTFKSLVRKNELFENYCANPDGDDLPWCFVEEGTSEFCDIARFVLYPWRISHKEP